MHHKNKRDQFSGPDYIAKHGSVPSRTTEGFPSIVTVEIRCAGLRRVPVNSAEVAAQVPKP